MIYQVRRYDPLQLVNHGFAITLLVNLRGRGMALRTPQSQQNIIQSRDRFTGVGVSGVELVVQCVDVLRDPKGTFAEDSDVRSLYRQGTNVTIFRLSNCSITRPARWRRLRANR